VHKQATQEAKFCYRCAAPRVPEHRPPLCVGKAKRKRNKELRELSGVLQAQPFSPHGPFCSCLSLPQVSSTSSPSPEVLGPSHAPHSAASPHLAAWSWHCWKASGNAAASPAPAAHIAWDCCENSSVVQSGFPVGKGHRRHKARETRQEASCSVCGRKA